MQCQGHRALLKFRITQGANYKHGQLVYLAHLEREKNAHASIAGGILRL